PPSCERTPPPAAASCYVPYSVTCLPRLSLTHRLKHGQFIKGLAVQLPACAVLADPTPLLEEEWHLGSAALLQDRLHPIPPHGTSTRSLLAADDHPRDALKV